MIGTNNTGKERDKTTPRNTVPEAIAGVQAVVADIRARLPDSKILMLAIFPRGTLDAPQRAQVALINTVIAKLDDGKMVRYLDIDPNFLESDGTLPEASCRTCCIPTSTATEFGRTRWSRRWMKC